MILYLYLFLLLLLYIFLIHYFIKNKAFITKILITLSISIFFIFLYQSIRDSEGYATSDQLPQSFYILNSYVYKDSVLILVKEKNSNPRLYKINKSLKLNKFLKKYKGLKNDGQDVVVKKDKKNNKDSLGMYIESVQKKMPLK